MKNNIDINSDKYILYLYDEGPVAIAIEKSKIIHDLIEKHGSIEKVPKDKTTEGYYIKNNNATEEVLKKSHLNEFKICELKVYPNYRSVSR